MNRKTNPVSKTLVLLAALALLAGDGDPIAASTRRPANSGNAQSRMVSVVIRGFRFDPETVTVNQGDTVEWKNDDIVPHTATEAVSKPSFDSGTIQTGSA